MELVKYKRKKKNGGKEEGYDLEGGENRKKNVNEHGKSI